MPTLTIRIVDKSVHTFLRKKAAEHGNSMEAEVRGILRKTMEQSQTKPIDAAQRIHALFAEIGGADDLVDVLPKRDKEAGRSATFKE
jgi:plasmid stability protein